jgi:AcrR family transcriptional regulator
MATRFPLPAINHFKNKWRCSVAKKSAVPAKRPAAPRKKPAKRRSIGRPAAHAECVGREGLIETTCQLLRELPPNQVTRAEVARQANVDPSLIRYYFQDRTSLLVAATERITANFSRSLAKAATRGGDSAEGKLRARVGAIIDLIVTFPFFHRLFIEELGGAPGSAGEKLLRATVLEGVNDLRAIINEGVRKGEMRQTNVPFLFISLLGMAEFFVGGTPVLKIAVGGKLDAVASVKRYKTFVADMLLNGLRPVA